MTIPTGPPSTTVRELIGSWDLVDVSDIAAVRREAARLCGRIPPFLLPPGSPVLAAAKERLVVILTELAANALTHADPPVAVALENSPTSWFLAVSDGSPGRPPLPTDGTPADRGGRGLALMTALASSCGWFTDAGTKVIWAEIPDQASADLLATLRAG
jgi:hypothetical protein